MMAHGDEQGAMVQVQLDAWTRCVGRWQDRRHSMVCIRIWCFHQPVNVWVEETSVIGLELDKFEEER